MRFGRSAVPTMLIKLIGATLFKMSRNRNFLIRRSGSELRLDLDLAVVLSVAVTAIRQMECSEFDWSE